MKLSAPRALCVCGVVAITLLTLSPSRAEPAPVANASNKAAAEALFQQGVDLTQAGDFAPACQKFAASQKLDPAVGTMLRLADCYDQIGRTASAWALFKEVEPLARSRGQARRAEIARHRAQDLERRLTKLALVVPEPAPRGLRLKINDLDIPAPSWGTALPVDPGRVTLHLSAPGKRSWQRRLQLSDREQRRVEMPQLKDLPAARKPLSARSQPATASTDDLADAKPNKTWRILGWTASGLGVLALGAGGFLAYRAYVLNQDSLAQCRTDRPNRCTAAGLDLRNQAGTSADASTVSLALGGTLLTTGVVILLTDPAGGEEDPTLDDRSNGKRELALGITPTDRGGAMQLWGTW